jgi:hypothetical protein
MRIEDRDTRFEDFYSSVLVPRTSILPSWPSEGWRQQCEEGSLETLERKPSCYGDIPVRPRAAAGDAWGKRRIGKRLFPRGEDVRSRIVEQGICRELGIQKPMYGSSWQISKKTAILTQKGNRIREWRGRGRRRKADRNPSQSG